MESSQYEPPVRRSLSDEELAARVQLATTSHSGVEALMELLVAQEALRAQEDSDIEYWIERMEAEGSPAALEALSKFQAKSFASHSQPVAIEPITPVTPEVIVPLEPVVEEVEVETEEVKPFSWFTQPEETEVESVVEAIEPEVEPVVIIEQVITEPEAVVVEVVQEIVEPVEQLQPEGSESLDEFERLISAAAAEEELTVSEPLVFEAEEVESNILVPTDTHRDRKPLSQLLIWIGASATLVPILLTYALISLGLSATAVVTDLAVGYLVAGLLVATSALAGKRSGLSAATISRAIFGVWGNSIPLALVALSRLALTVIGVMAFLMISDGIEVRIPAFATSVGQFAGMQFTVGFVVAIALVAGVALLSLTKGIVSRISQVAFSVVAFVLVAESFIGLTETKYGFTAPGNASVLSMESLAGVALVVMVVSLMFVSIAPNLSKSIPMSQRGIKVFSAVLVAQAIIPTLIGVAALLWLGPAMATNPTIASAVLALPQWSRGALVSGVVLGLVLLITFSLKSAALDLVSLLHIRSRSLTTLIAATLTVIAVFFVTQLVDQFASLQIVLNLAAIACAGWIGMFVSDLALRRIAYHELSLTRSYGYYGKFNFLSVILWLVSVTVGLLITPVTVPGASFVGMFAGVLGLANNLGGQALAFGIVLVVGKLFTVVLRVPQIRKQEKEVLAVESRREALNDIFIGQE